MIEIPNQRVERVASAEIALKLWAEHASYYGHDARGIFFCHQFRQLIPVKALCQNLFPANAKFSLVTATWTFQNGATLKMRHLWDDCFCDEYAGQSFTFMVFDHVHDWRRQDAIRLMAEHLRSHKGVPLHFLTTGEV
jgi:hypothetical protein